MNGMGAAIATMALAIASCRADQGTDAAGNRAATSTQAVGNPVRNEMRALHQATRDWVTAISYNNLRAIPASVRKVHQARMVTEAALAKGAYAPPKNADKLGEFKELDEKFHAQLVRLVRSAEADDLPATTRQLGVVLDACTNCHMKFRF